MNVPRHSPGHAHGVRSGLVLLSEVAAAGHAGVEPDDELLRDGVAAEHAEVLDTVIAVLLVAALGELVVALALRAGPLDVIRCVQAGERALRSGVARPGDVVAVPVHLTRHRSAPAAEDQAQRD